MAVPFASLFERRDSLENPSTNLYQALTGYLDGAPTSAGISLSDEQAAQVPDVFACIQVLAQDLAKTPLKLRQQRDDGRHEDATNHRLWEILHDLPNPEMTAYQFRFEMQRNLLTHSKAYAEIVRRPSGEVASLWVLHSPYMTITRDGLNRKVYSYEPPNMPPQRWVFDADRPPILDLSHRSPIAHCRDLIALAAALERFASKFFANGARVSGILEAPVGFSENAKKNLRESFAALYQSVANAHKVPLLEAGVTFKPVSAPNDEAQFIETRKYVRTQIAGEFRVPPHKIGDLERATFSNIEHQGIDYVTGALDPFFVSWEQAIKRDLLTTRQFPRYEAVFDRESLIRADIASRYAAFNIARQGGWFSANDILRKLDENPIGATDGGDLYLVNGSMTPVTKAGERSPQQPAAPAGEGA